MSTLSTYNTSKNRRRLLSFGLSMAVFIFMFALLFIKKNLDGLVKDELVIREISLATPPPPPPPPQQQQERVEAEVQLNVEGKGPPIQVSEIKMEDPLEAFDLMTPNIQTLTTDWDLDLEVNWTAYGLDELDSTPSLLTSLRADWPQELTKQGIEHVVVRLDVFIDETGRINLVSILENAFPILNKPIERVIKAARFSIPQKGGEAVRARFIWPVEFIKP